MDFNTRHSFRALHVHKIEIKTSWHSLNIDAATFLFASEEDDRGVGFALAPLQSGVDSCSTKRASLLPGKKEGRWILTKEKDAKISFLSMM